MLLLVLQIASFTLAAFSLSYCLVEQNLRNRRSWEAIAVRVQTSAGTSPRAMFLHAGAVMQLVDFAEFRTVGIDSAVLRTLRNEAIAIRISSMRAMLGSSAKK